MSCRYYHFLNFRACLNWQSVLFAQTLCCVLFFILSCFWADIFVSCHQLKLQTLLDCLLAIWISNFYCSPVNHVFPIVAYSCFSLILSLPSQLSIPGAALESGHPSDRRCTFSVCTGNTAENQLQWPWSAAQGHPRWSSWSWEANR